MVQYFKIYFLILFLFAFNYTGFGLSEHSGISILTYEPGSELYTVFGHSAIRIKDPVLKLDRIYNFGTFDFSSPFFYIKFLRGELNYSLSIIDYNTIYHYSLLEQRTVHEQDLDLSQQRKSEIFTQLKRMYSSEERYYKYDFFYDNCATRIRDVVLNNGLDSYSVDTSNFCCTTFRKLLIPYLSNHYWLNVSVNLVLGNRADKIANSTEYFFLPDYIFRILDSSDLVLDKRLLFDFSSSDEERKDWGKIILIPFVLILLSGALYHRTTKITFYILNGLIGVVGLVLLLLTAFSGNEAFLTNYNIIWTLPPLVILVLKGKIRLFTQTMYLLYLIVLIILRANLYTGFSSTFLPWILILMVVNSIDLGVIKRIKILS